MSHSLQWWFKLIDALPVPKDPLCTTIRSVIVRDVNKEVRKVGTSSTLFRGAYVKVTSEQQAKIAE